MNDTTSAPIVGIVAGSKSDQPLVDKITKILDEFGVGWEFQVMSAHRTPKKCARYATEARGRGLKILIGVAGLAAALPGALASHTLLPVIGVPGEGGPLAGSDALYSIVQMPPGVPVATVGIGNGQNAAHLALRIIASGDAGLLAKLEAWRRGFGDE